MKTRLIIVLVGIIFSTQIPKNSYAESDSTKVVNCFHRLIFEGYNSDDYSMFINNTFYGELPQVGSGYPSNHKHKAAVKNPELAKKVNNMHTLDQAARSWEQAQVNADNGKIWQRVVKFDSANQAEIIKMTQQYGIIPAQSEIGEEAASAMIIMLRHLGGTDSSNFEYLYPFLIKQAKQGNFPCEQIASLIDYYFLGNKPIMVNASTGYPSQLFGTISFRLNDEKRILVPITNWENTEQLRKEIGLSSLKEEMAKNHNLVYDEELFKTRYAQPIQN